MRALYCGTLVLQWFVTARSVSPAIGQGARREATLVFQSRLGSKTGEELTTITQVAASARFVYVGQENLQGIRVFSRDGRYVKTIGRSGGGPGEFRELQFFGLLGDTLWTIDSGLRRITLFSDTGRVLSTDVIDQLGTRTKPLAKPYYSMPVALAPKGAVLGHGATTGQALARGDVTEYPVLLLTRRGLAKDTLGWFSVTNADLIVRSKRLTTYMPQPFPDHPLVAYYGQQGRVCIVDRAFAEHSPPGVVKISCLGTKRDTVWRRTLTLPVRPIPNDVVDSVRRRLSRALRPRFSQTEIDKALHVPKFAAPVVDALGGADGSLWLRMEARQGSATYFVLSPDGRDLRTVRVKQTLRVLWANGAEVWVEERDSDDVPSLSRYMILERPAGG